jgi:hypothetical protein
MTKKEYQKQYYLDNKEKIKAQAKEYFEANKERQKQYQKEYKASTNKKYPTDKRLQKEWREANKEQIKTKAKIYREVNKDKIREKAKEYVKNKRKTDPLFRLKDNVKSNIRQSLKYLGGKKLTQTELILGCSFDAFRQHLETQFEPWMSWDNYGNWNGVPTEPNTSWDVDHITPISSAITQDELIKLNHYTNLKPMCSYTNRWIKRNNLM